MQDHNTSIPEGLCQCGCGKLTRIPKRTILSRGHIKGKHDSYLPRHSEVKHGMLAFESSEDGLCLCGCGKQTEIATRTVGSRGWVRGKSKPFYGMHRRTCEKGPRYIVDPVTGCWDWQWKLNIGGYGQTNKDGRTLSAHVLFYEETNGPVPEGKVLDHLCRNRRCCNPAHLEPVSFTENIRRGIATYITREQACEIMELYGTMTGHDVARKFSITPTRVYQIWGKRGWNDITPDKPNRKSFGTKGIINGRAKLTELQVCEIRELQGYASPNSVARKYNVSRSAIMGIWRGKTWKPITFDKG